MKTEKNGRGLNWVWDRISIQPPTNDGRRLMDNGERTTNYGFPIRRLKNRILDLVYTYGTGWILLE